jgi:vibriolysin
MGGVRIRFCLAACMTALVACQPEDPPEEEAGSRAEVVLAADDGVPTHVAGDLGHAPGDLDDAADPALAMEPLLAEVAPLLQARADQLRLVAMDIDDIGFRHLHYRQELNGLEVVGGELDLHVDHEGVLYLAAGSARDLDVPATPGITLEVARAALASDARTADLAAGAGRLVYLVASQGGAAHLAWEIAARGERDGEPVADLVYVDADAGDLIDIHPSIHTARNRATYNLNHGTNLPGALARTEGQGAVADTDVNHAHDFAGVTYDCYKALFNRDSYDNAGAQLKSSVHYSSNYVNAFWNGTQMVYGDGDGSTAAPLDRALDVVSHELTHAVTEKESGLVYQNEPGALNEASSDIFGAICEAWKDGAVSGATWKLGEDVWTPGTAGDALRYMNNPTLDGSSRDYYPERYAGTQDYGGVHWNSGIGNLAFYLAVAGGQHPRNKTAVTVTGLGIEVAAQIWYRAATVYYQSNTNMAGARAACVQAAVDLYPADPSVKKSVEDAWSAVGVGTSSQPDPSGSVLENAVPVSNLSGATGSKRRFTFVVPSGVSSVTFKTSGGSGDADLYIKRGSAPDLDDWQYRSIRSDNDETITVTSGMAGTWYVMVYGYAAYSGLSLTASYTAPLASATWKNLEAATGDKIRKSFVVPAGASKVTFKITGGTGDADLYVRFGEPPTVNLWDYRPYLVGNEETVVVTSPRAGTWYLMVRAYTGYSGVTLKAIAE